MTSLHVSEMFKDWLYLIYLIVIVFIFEYGYDVGSWRISVLVKKKILKTQTRNGPKVFTLFLLTSYGAIFLVGTACILVEAEHEPISNDNFGAFAIATYTKYRNLEMLRVIAIGEDRNFYFQCLQTVDKSLLPTHPNDLGQSTQLGFDVPYQEPAFMAYSKQNKEILITKGTGEIMIYTHNYDR